MSQRFWTRIASPAPEARFRKPALGGFLPFNIPLPFREGCLDLAAAWSKLGEAVAILWIVRAADPLPLIQLRLERVSI